MDMSRLISSIKQQLGLYQITLPFTDEQGVPIPTENIIWNVLKTTTIPTYSRYQPWFKEDTVNMQHMKRVDHFNNLYILPMTLTTTPIMYVTSVNLPHMNTRGQFGDIAPAYGINQSVRGVLTSQAYMMLVSQMRAEPTFEYKPPNQIQLLGYPRSYITIRVAAEHQANGESIDAGCYDSFYQLAMLDMKMFLYNNLKLYDNIATAHGNISLRVEDHQGAESERHAMLEDWRDKFHADMMWETFF